MRNIEIRPNLKTAGGEFSDIMVGGRFAGTLALIYREGDRITGSVQLEKDSLKIADKQRVESYLRDYIQFFIHAVQAETCDVVMTFSRYDHIVTTDENDYEAATETETEDFDPQDLHDYSERQSAYISEENEDLAEDWESADYELVMVNKKRNRIEYHIYDSGKWIAEAFFRTDHADISGEVRWVFEPDDDEVENMTELLISDFDEDTIDTFTINHKFDGELIETFELTHKDLLDTPKDKDYSVVLARDDGDVLTYEIYQQSAGKMPIGTATVNIQHRRLTGFIDFRDRSKVNDAEAISSLLMLELDKEKDYSGLSLSLMFKNEFVDELIFDNDSVH